MTWPYRGSGQPGLSVDRNPGAAARIPPDPRPEGAKLRATAVVWNLAWEGVRRLPEPLAFALADLGGRLAWLLGAASRARVTANLARVTPPNELDRAVRLAFRSYARYWVEAFRAADLAPDDLDRRTTTDGFEHLDGVLDRGRGAVVLLAHHGSWDVAAQWAETHGYHLAVVAEVVRPRRLFEKFVRLRETVGLEVVPLRKGPGGAGGSRPPDQDDLVGRLSQVLAANHLTGLLAERDLTRKGVEVDFFGEPTRLPRGPVVLSQRTGAAIVPITLLQRPGRRWHLQVLAPVDVDGVGVEEGVQRIARALEALICLDPTQWHAFQRVWSAG
jgi:lauroyl/myristoyl acyltransferase